MTEAGKQTTKSIALNYLYLSPAHAGGKDQVGMNLLKGFQQMGAAEEMLVICYDYSEGSVRQTAPDAQIAVLPSGRGRGELNRLIRLQWDNTFRVPGIVKKHGIKLIYHMNCMNGLIRQPAVSVVIPHDIKAVSHRIIGDLKIPYYNYLLCRLVYALDFKHADSVIAISQSDCSEMLEYYPQYGGKIKQIYNPVDVGEAGGPLWDREDYICAVNLQFHHKNIITLLQAFEMLGDRAGCNLVLVGSVPDRVHYLVDYVKEHNLEGRVRFTGFVSEEERCRILAGSRLYVNPSLYEGFGMTAIEAMILKVPALVSAIPANCEVTKGLCSYYGPADDAGALADAIAACLAEPADADKLDRISEAMTAQYHYLQISKKYYEWFQELIGRRESASRP